MEYIDLIQCHDIEFGDLDQIINETLPALHTLKAKGLVRFIGITGLPLSAFHYVLDRVPKGTVDVVLSYCHNSLNDQSLIQELLYFEEKGVGVINASPLSMGLLTKEGPPTWHPAPVVLKDLAIKAASLAESRGMDIAKIALAHSLKLSNAGISSTLIGMSTREEVTKNVSCCLEALGLVTSEGALDQDTTREIAEMFKVARDNPLKYSW
jgi:L-galactose dehydrogenase